MSALEPSGMIIDRVAELLRTEVGLRPEPALRARLRRCIRDEAAGLRMDPEHYLQALSSSAALCQDLLNRVTVQETGFFRHPEHFEVLSRDILPILPQPVTIWSAGCANGQEAFSLAMLLEERGVTGSVIATDVSTSALHRTRAARYTAGEVRGLAPDRIARHLTPVGQSWEINQSLRDRVSPLHHNLTDAVPDRVRPCQLVFCRNVLIYFSPQHAKVFLDRVANALPAAWLFLGAAETIRAAGDRYETVRIGDTYAYRPLAVPGVPSPVTAERAPATAVRALVNGKQAPARLASPERVPPLEADNESAAIARLAAAGQQAFAARDERAAVVIFRKWVYLAQDDALAHLHLALALEALGEQLSAQRAFGAARRALLASDPAQLRFAIDGYDPAELHRLLDAKQREQTP
ncbi:CheR family methyltransferase [Pseudarthrobacter sp. N5]|uniref:CheR family methyltransferase n=1 Tax=Pseudarthrobacter sp. N5 TaxID=3418416 RepID=UPI003CF1C49B